VGYGATQEIGPFLVDTDGKGIKFNNFSWNKGMRTTNIYIIGDSILCSTIHLTSFYGNILNCDDLSLPHISPSLFVLYRIDNKN
jgi:hypothetical protein